MIFLVLHNPFDDLVFLIGFWQEYATFLACLVGCPEHYMVHPDAIAQYILGYAEIPVNITSLIHLPLIFGVVLVPQFLICWILPQKHHERLPRFVIDVRIKVVLFDAEALCWHHGDHRVLYRLLPQLMRCKQKVVYVVEVFAEGLILAELRHLEKLLLIHFRIVYK